ncbi:hypothetical protein MSI_23000 [Treponema sp. JC4]|uniref:DUF4384 domain-containing protein n=1 Tax=Treponema sp. JC4 TaxID=1124982 RepID=UPI00025B05B6|nr:DUF4384 domain-containing protein [Treponema sp. JC4]EID84234.1 hypothetical protein MSI_23000 [Treponema sp. JC4]
MRKLAKLCAICIVFSIGMPFYAKDSEFEDLLNKAATEVTADIENSVTSIAILDVQTEYWAVSDYIVDELAHYFTRRFGVGNVIAHDEFTRSLIEKELDYQQSGSVSDETIQEIGRELGVDCVIIGEFTEISSGYQLFVKANHVETKKILCSWKAKIKKTDKEVKFQIEKSKKGSRPVAQVSSKQKNQSQKSTTGLMASMINENGDDVSVLYPADIIRFRVSSEKNAYLAILCIDAKGDEEWLPIQNNYIRAGESRIFPDIPGAVLRVDEGMFGDEQVVVYAANTEEELPNRKSIMAINGSRGLSLVSGSTSAVKETINYTIKRR